MIFGSGAAESVQKNLEGARSPHVSLPDAARPVHPAGSVKRKVSYP